MTGFRVVTVVGIRGVGYPRCRLPEMVDGAVRRRAGPNFEGEKRKIIHTSDIP